MSYTFDALNRMDTVSDTGSGIQLADYDWDTLSRRDLSRFNAGAFAADYAYENDDDLSVLAHTGPAPLSFTIGRNAGSQITNLAVSDGAFLATPATTQTESYTANKLNQIQALNGTAYVYDANGNLTAEGTYSYEYDEENRLRAALGAGNTVSYEYDPLGRRRAKIVNGLTTRYASDGAEEIEERDGSNSVLRRYAYGPAVDDRIAIFDSAYCPASPAAHSWCFYLSNWQGSTTTMVKRDGSLREVYHYGPYGEGVNWTPSDALSGNPFRYTGRRVDPETGLYYYRARYYSPKLGRFLQTDPIGTKDDINLYAYAYNDPLNRVDPTGLQGEKTCPPDCPTPSPTLQSTAPQTDATETGQDSSDPRPKTERTGGPDPSYKPAMEKVENEIKEAEKQIGKDMTPVAHRDTTGAGIDAQNAVDAESIRSEAADAAAVAKAKGDGVEEQHERERVDRQLVRYHRAIKQPLNPNDTDQGGQ